MQTKVTKTALRLSLVTLSAAFILGCVPNAAVNSSNESVGVYGYKGAAQAFLDDSGAPSVNPDDLHELLVAGKALHDAGMWEQSREVLDIAGQQLMWKEDTIDTPSEALKFIGTTLTNDTLAGYNGKIYEGLMLDYYQAINNLMLGDESSARVSFNRLEERQGNAEIQLQSYTRSLNDADIEVDDQQDLEIVEQTVADADVNFAQGLANLPENQMAAQIRSPSGDLLNALFRQTSSASADRSSDRTKRAIKAVQAKAPDATARRFAGALEQSFANLKADHVFVLYEDGSGPSIEEFRVDLPLALVSDDLLYAGVALPEFRQGYVNNQSLTLTQGSLATDTVPVTDMNRIASLEFSAAYDKKVAKEVTSAIIKTVAQVAANKAIDQEVDNPLAGLLMKVAVAGTQAALTRADTRHWVNLPNQIQMTSFKKAGTEAIKIFDAVGNPIVTVPALPGHQLIYVRQQTRGGDVKVYAQRLPANDRAVEYVTNWVPAE